MPQACINLSPIDQNLILPTRTQTGLLCCTVQLLFCTVRTGREQAQLSLSVSYGPRPLLPRPTKHKVLWTSRSERRGARSEERGMQPAASSRWVISITGGCHAPPSSSSSSSGEWEGEQEFAELNDEVEGLLGSLGYSSGACKCTTTTRRMPCPARFRPLQAAAPLVRLRQTPWLRFASCRPSTTPFCPRFNASAEDARTDNMVYEYVYSSSPALVAGASGSFCRAYCFNVSGVGSPPRSRFRFHYQTRAGHSQQLKLKGMCRFLDGRKPNLLVIAIQCPSPDSRVRDPIICHADAAQIIC